MPNQYFDERLKICVFRSITNDLRKRRLITEEEFTKIMQRIEKMETDIVVPTSPKVDRKRDLTVIH